MNVTICSPFRDSAVFLRPYLDRLARLDWPGAALRFVFVEGDSIDETWPCLAVTAMSDPRVTLRRCDTGRSRYGSVVNAERFWTLATVFNAGLAVVDLQWSDAVLFLPCDIDYDPDLLRRLAGWEKDIISPYVWQDGVFYDVWAFSRNGRDYVGFGRDTVTETEPIRMDTVGGIVLIDAKVLRAGVRYTFDSVDRGLCELARAKGFTVWADPTTNVWHGGGRA